MLVKIIPVFISVRKYFIVHIKIVLLNGRYLGCIKINTQIPDFFIAYRFSPKNQRRPCVYRLRCRLLVISPCQSAGRIFHISVLVKLVICYS